jgi:hypothetical protein
MRTIARVGSFAFVACSFLFASRAVADEARPAPLDPGTPDSALVADPAAAPLPVSSEPFTLRVPATAWRCGGPGSPCAPCAPPPPPNPCDDPCCYACPRWHLTIGAWVWGLDGQLGDEDNETDIDSDWTDTLENLDSLEFALNARLRVEWGKWAVTVEVDGADVEDTVDFERLGVAVDGEASIWTLQAQLGYRFAGGHMGCGPCRPSYCIEAYAGFRAWWVDTEIEPQGSTVPLPTLDADESWIDPIVGLRAEFRWPNGWSLLAEGDIGGFGIGSDFSWHLLAAVGYSFNDHVQLSLGWKVLDVDYDDDGFVFDVQMSGPFVALTFSF